MKFKDLPDLTAMYREEVEELCKDIDGDVEYIHISTGKHIYDTKRVIRYKIINKESRETLVVEMTGFPTIEYEDIQK
ncbi:MAG: hypothetical protein KAQ68_02945 [Clostridiales bacterium]|nr:hypothetical protein [Clostridiales bacterium]